MLSGSKDVSKLQPSEVSKWFLSFLSWWLNALVHCALVQLWICRFKNQPNHHNYVFCFIYYCIQLPGWKYFIICSRPSLESTIKCWWCLPVMVPALLIFWLPLWKPAWWQDILINIFCYILPMWAIKILDFHCKTRQPGNPNAKHCWVILAQSLCFLRIPVSYTTHTWAVLLFVRQPAHLILPCYGLL